MQVQLQGLAYNVSALFAPAVIDIHTESLNSRCIKFYPDTEPYEISFQMSKFSIRNIALRWDDNAIARLLWISFHTSLKNTLVELSNGDFIIHYYDRTNDYCSKDIIYNKQLYDYWLQAVLERFV